MFVNALSFFQKRRLISRLYIWGSINVFESYLHHAPVPTTSFLRVRLRKTHISMSEEGKYSIYSIHELKSSRRVERLKNRANYESKSSHALLWSTFFTCEDAWGEAEGVAIFENGDDVKTIEKFFKCPKDVRKTNFENRVYVENSLLHWGGLQVLFFLIVVCPLLLFLPYHTVGVGLKEQKFQPADAYRILHEKRTSIENEIRRRVLFEIKITLLVWAEEGNF